MAVTNLKSISIAIALAIAILSFQNCSPAQFNGVQAPGSEKGAGLLDPANLPDPAAPITEPTPAPTPKPPSPEPQSSCIDKNRLEIQSKDGIPMAKCLSDSDEMCVVICHVPPGNSSAKHTILISPQAVEAHMNHGARAQTMHSRQDRTSRDSFGPCEDSDHEQEAEVCEEVDQEHQPRPTPRSQSHQRSC